MRTLNIDRKQVVVLPDELFSECESPAFAHHEPECVFRGFLKCDKQLLSQGIETMLILVVHDATKVPEVERDEFHALRQNDHSCSVFDAMSDSQLIEHV